MCNEEGTLCEHIEKQRARQRVYNKTFYENHKEKVKALTISKYNENKEEYLKKMKEYQENHKEELNDKYNKKHNCECGGRYTHRNKSTHLKSKKHNTYLESLESKEKNS